MEHGKIPPQAIEFETAVLGALLLEKDAITKVAGILQPESFYKNEHQILFRAILEMYNKSQAIDMLTVTEELRRVSKLDEVGGVAFITQLTSSVASASHIQHHAQIIQQKAISREIIAITSKVNEDCFNDEVDVADNIDYLVTKINQLRINKKNGRYLKEIGRERLGEIEENCKGDKKITGISSGFKSLDHLTGGWQNGNLIILAARPAMGKSRIAQELVVNPCKEAKTVALFSLEMTDKELYDRTLSAYTGIDTQAMRNGQIKDHHWENIDNAVGKIDKLRFIVDDQPALHITEFRSKANFYKLNHNVDMIVLDYLQLMKARTANSTMNREQEVAEISQTLKAVAKDLDIPIIALAQLNRALENRSGYYGKVPIMADLRDSGQIEQDADMVIFIHRPEYYGFEQDQEGMSTRNLITLYVQKNRGGDTGYMNLYRNNNWSTITEETAAESHEDCPY